MRNVGVCVVRARVCERVGCSHELHVEEAISHESDVLALVQIEQRRRAALVQSSVGEIGDDHIDLSGLCRSLRRSCAHDGEYSSDQCSGCNVGGPVASRRLLLELVCAVLSRCMCCSTPFPPIRNASPRGLYPTKLGFGRCGTAHPTKSQPPHNPSLHGSQSWVALSPWQRTHPLFPQGKFVKASPNGQTFIRPKVDLVR